MNTDKKRCAWAEGDDELMRSYHDTEWRVPLRDDNKLFECLCLESFQSGLSWKTILHKRENFRKAFVQFDPQKVARFSVRDVERLMHDEKIVRNRMKIEATINNAKRFLHVQKEFGTFATYIWNFVENESEGDVSVICATDLKKRGFKFLGPTTVYAFMQAIGMMGDHEPMCFKCKKCD